MDMSSHTPGPWDCIPGADNEKSVWLICGPGQSYIGQVDAEDGEGLNEDDARLIAAAPDLLEALKTVYRTK